MDKDVEKRLDSIVEDELRKGYRTKELPKELIEQLTGYGVPVFERYRLTRMNPARRRKMNETVQRSYHRDLQTPEILSEAQIMKLVVARDEWGPDKEARIGELQRATNAAMSGLYLEGFTNDTSEWAAEILEQSEIWRGALVASELTDEQQTTATVLFDRWMEYSSDKKADYTARFAAEQKRDEYSPDADAMAICDALPTIESINAIHQLEALLDKVHRFVKLTEARQELAELQMKKARMFSDSVESRRENAEEMARLYFTCERVDGTGMPAGPLMTTFDGLWDLPDDVIQHLLVESYFFHNGIPDEARPYLETFGFIRAETDPSDESSTPQPSTSLEPEASADSPEATKSNSATSEAAATP